MYFLVYKKIDGEMVNLSFTKDESGANAFKSEKLDAVEIPESFYNQLFTNKQFAYVKGDEIVLRPPPPYQYAKWNVNTKEWELDAEYKAASEAEMAMEK